MSWLWVVPVGIVGSAPLLAAMAARRLRLAVADLDADTAHLAQLRLEIIALRSDADALQRRLVNRRAASGPPVDDR